MNNNQEKIEYKSPQKTINDAIDELMEICDRQTILHAGAAVIIATDKAIKALDILLKQDRITKGDIKALKKCLQKQIEKTEKEILSLKENDEKDERDTTE